MGRPAVGAGPGLIDPGKGRPAVGTEELSAQVAAQAAGGPEELLGALRKDVRGIGEERAIGPDGRDDVREAVDAHGKPYAGAHEGSLACGAMVARLGWDAGAEGAALRQARYRADGTRSPKALRSIAS